MEKRNFVIEERRCRAYIRTRASRRTPPSPRCTESRARAFKALASLAREREKASAREREAFQGRVHWARPGHCRGWIIDCQGRACRCIVRSLSLSPAATAARLSRILAHTHTYIYQCSTDADKVGFLLYVYTYTCVCVCARVVLSWRASAKMHHTRERMSDMCTGGWLSPPPLYKPAITCSPSIFYRSFFMFL